MNDEMDDDELRKRVSNVLERIEIARDRIRIHHETPEEQTNRRISDLEEEIRSIRALNATLQKEIEVLKYEDLESQRRSSD